MVDTGRGVVEGRADVRLPRASERGATGEVFVVKGDTRGSDIRHVHHYGGVIVSIRQDDRAWGTDRRGRAGVSATRVAERELKIAADVEPRTPLVVGAAIMTRDEHEWVVEVGVKADVGLNGEACVIEDSFVRERKTIEVLETRRGAVRHARLWNWIGVHGTGATGPQRDLDG